MYLDTCIAEYFNVNGGLQCYDEKNNQQTIETRRNTTNKLYLSRRHNSICNSTIVTHNHDRLAQCCNSKQVVVVQRSACAKLFTVTSLDDVENDSSNTGHRVHRERDTRHVIYYPVKPIEAFYFIFSQTVLKPLAVFEPLSWLNI